MSDSVRPHRRQPTWLLCPWDSPDNNTGVGCHFLLQCMKVKSEPDPSSKATLGGKAQHEGALPPPCIVRKDPRVPHTARRQYHSSKASSALSFLHSPTLTYNHQASTCLTLTTGLFCWGLPAQSVGIDVRGLVEEGFCPSWLRVISVCVHSLVLCLAQSGCSKEVCWKK